MGRVGTMPFALSTHARKSRYLFAGRPSRSSRGQEQTRAWRRVHKKKLAKERTKGGSWLRSRTSGSVGFVAFRAKNISLYCHSETYERSNRKQGRRRCRRVKAPRNATAIFESSRLNAKQKPRLVRSLGTCLLSICNVGRTIGVEFEVYREAR